MHNLLIYALWLQVFANTISVIVTFMIGRMAITPSKQWYTFSASLLFALVYRILKIIVNSPSVELEPLFESRLILIGDMVVLPLVAIFIMVFTIQIYKLLKTKI